MATEPVWLLTDEDGFTLELSKQFRPDNYLPSTGGQTNLYRAYGSDKVYQSSDSLGLPQPLRLSALLYDVDEVSLQAQIEIYAKLMQKAAAITRDGSSIPTITLIRGANYIEFEVQPKAKRVRMTLVLVPDKLVNAVSVWGV